MPPNLKFEKTKFVSVSQKLHNPTDIVLVVMLTVPLIRLDIWALWLDLPLETFLEILVERRNFQEFRTTGVAMRRHYFNMIFDKTAHTFSASKKWSSTKLNLSYKVQQQISNWFINHKSSILNLPIFHKIFRLRVSCAAS